MLLAGTCFSRFRVNGQMDSSSFWNCIWGTWKWQNVSMEMCVHSCHVAFETALLTVLVPPLSYLCWRPLAQGSALLAKTCCLLIMLWFWPLISLQCASFCSFVGPPWDFLCDPNPYSPQFDRDEPASLNSSRCLDLPNFSVLFQCESEMD